MIQVKEYSLSMCEFLSLNPSVPQNEDD
jgi:hypothetical protein